MDSFSIFMSHPEVLPGRGWELAWGQFTVTKGSPSQLPIQWPGVIKLLIQAKILNILGLVVQGTIEDMM